jgi:hypothetical protein
MPRDVADAVARLQEKRAISAGASGEESRLEAIDKLLPPLLEVQASLRSPTSTMETTALPPQDFDVLITDIKDADFGVMGRD